MEYIDGASGWSKWTAEGEESTITLRLVICDKDANSLWIGDWFDKQMTHSDPRSYVTSDHEYSLIVNSLEVRFEKQRSQ